MKSNKVLLIYSRITSLDDMGIFAEWKMFAFLKPSLNGVRTPNISEADRGWLGKFLFERQWKYIN